MAGIRWQRRRRRRILQRITIIITTTVAAALLWLFAVSQLPGFREATTPPESATTNLEPTAQLNITQVTPTWTATPINNEITTPQGAWATLQQQMLALINRERLAHNLNGVDWDSLAAVAGKQHAEDMAVNGYFSHWNLAGLGPDHRYSLAGNSHAVQENLYIFTYAYGDGRPAPIEDWPVIIEQAHQGLMNSPGHRTNILHPAHTHLGIGMAYNQATGVFLLAQEFTNQYVTFDQPLPVQTVATQALVVTGQFAGQGLTNPLLNIVYEPFPTPMSLDELAQTNVYRSAATTVDTRSIELAFSETVSLGNQGPGYYHIRLFVDLPGGQAMVVDQVIAVY